MFRFSNPEYLYLLIVLPVLVLLYLVVDLRQRKRLKTFGDPALMALLMPDVSVRRPRLKFFLQLTAMAICIVMIAGPEFGSKLEKSKRQGAELMIALDVSNSMMAQDIQPNRLAKAKQILSKLVDKLKDDKIGLVVFAGDAFTQLPITSDYVSAKMFMNTISPELVPTQGTAIGEAIDLCMKSFPPKGEAERAIIVITDGENFEDDATQAAKEAQKEGVKIHVVGLGLEQGSPIPMPNSSDFRKDKEGNVVITKLNEKMCQDIAAAGNGIYVRSDNSNAALKILEAQLDKMTKSNLESAVYSEYDEQFGGLAWIVLVLLVMDMFIMQRKNKRLRNVRLFTMLLLLTVAGSVSAQKAERSDIRKGNSQYERKKYTEAEIQYRKALEVNPKSKEGAYNLGNALFRQKKTKEALEQYQSALNVQNDPLKKSQIFHNAGNVFMENKEYDKAVDAYKNSLIINPSDNETRYNLAMAQALLKKQQQQQKQDKDKKKDQKDDQKDKQQQQQKQDDQEKKQNQNKKQEQQQQQQEQVSKEKARQLLDALSQDEKDTQEKVKKLQMQQSKSRKTDKDW
jgi:Ca-activated chloride channel family protein